MKELPDLALLTPQRAREIQQEVRCWAAEAFGPASDVPLRYDFAESSANPKAALLDGDDDLLNELCVLWLVRHTGSQRRGMARGQHLRTQCRAEHNRWPV